MIQKRSGGLGVHSVDHFGLQVPDLAEARRFYEAFGLEVRETAGELAVLGGGHRWASLVGGGPKRLRYLSFGAYEEDMKPFQNHLAGLGAQPIPVPAGAEAEGMWIRGFDGLPLQIKAAEKCSPNEKAPFAGQCDACFNSNAPKVTPRQLSHFALFTTDVEAATAFYERALGLRLSDGSPPFVAFLHGPHGSDHHLLALVKSEEGYGMHHNSWNVGSVQEVGLGAMQMGGAGYKRGWGLGRHVLGANYFHYVRDPWGSYSEYSADIDYIPADCDWPAKNHPPEDSMYLWGPDVPEDFIRNFETGERR